MHREHRRVGVGPPGDELRTEPRTRRGVPATSCATEPCSSDRRPDAHPRARPIATRSAGSRRTGHLPLGYFGDPEKTAETFPSRSAACATRRRRPRALRRRRPLLFLGRESVCINTGGEKVYAEEVERVVKSHPAIYDALVVGRAERALGAAGDRGRLAPPRADAPTRRRAPRALRAAPRRLQAPEGDRRRARRSCRSPSGKPDYAWAKQHASHCCPDCYPELNETQRLVRDTIRKVVERELKPHVPAMENGEITPFGPIKAFVAALGMGGEGELDGSDGGVGAGGQARALSSRPPSRSKCRASTAACSCRGESRSARSA